MSTYTTSGSITIPRSVTKLYVKLIGEGGGRGTDSNTAGTNGSNTTFLGVSAGGGNAGAYDTAGTGGTVTNTNSNITLSIQEDGNDAVGQVGGTGNRGGDGSAGTTAPSTTPCNSTNWTGGWISYPCPNDGGLQSCVNAQPANQCGTVGCGGVVEFDNFNSRCRCPTNTCAGGVPGNAVSHFRGGGGEGAYAEFSLISSQLDSLGYYDTPLSYSVNSNSGSGNSPGNGSIEFILFLPTVYIKTSSGWELVKDIYVNSNDVGIGWTTSATHVL